MLTHIKSKRYLLHTYCTPIGYAVAYDNVKLTITTQMTRGKEKTPTSQKSHFHNNPNNPHHRNHTNGSNISAAPRNDKQTKRRFHFITSLIGVDCKIAIFPTLLLGSGSAGLVVVGANFGAGRNCSSLPLHNNNRLFTGF